MSGKVPVNSPQLVKGVATSSMAVKVPAGRGLLFVRGLVASGPDGKATTDDFRAQARQIYEDLRTLIAEVDATLDDVVKVTNYLRDIKDLPTLQKIRGEFIPTNPPASTTVEISRLADDSLKLEIEAIVMLPD